MRKINRSSLKLGYCLTYYQLILGVLLRQSCYKSYLTKRIMSGRIAIAFMTVLVAVAAVNIKTESVDSQYVPIPKRFPGIVLGDANAPVNLELVYDPTCDGSAAFDSTIQEFTKGLDQDTLSKISFRYDINVLPYHISSFKLATAVRYVQGQLGNEEALRVLRYFLENIESWDEKSIEKITINAHLNNIAAKVSSLTGLNKDDIRKEIAHYSVTDGQTRQWAKYVMGSLRIPGTPQLLINGVRVDGATDMTTAQLTTLVKSLL